MDDINVDSGSPAQLAPHNQVAGHIRGKLLAPLVPSTAESHHVRQRQLVGHASRNILCHSSAAESTGGVPQPPGRSNRRAGECLFGAARAVKAALQLHFLPSGGEPRQPHHDALQSASGCGDEVVPSNSSRDVRKMSEAVAQRGAGLQGA
ncbi:hypothetical protein ANCDUO_09081 [Ancylostoma duodenale]|uniref:Uncharacterized protein n=1 Tax=Ancylostoma duodenale TaxID=51022 RepID=A0A0C2GU00_9BILA|nr:hypothetical protein ANCDUO_09081 [Ancylostoma duodenale]